MGGGGFENVFCSQFLCITYIHLLMGKKRMVPEEKRKEMLSRESVPKISKLNQKA